MTALVGYLHPISWNATDSIQELFMRKDPFPGCRGFTSVILRIMRGPPDRLSDDATWYRMIDQWWNMLSPCWKRDPNMRPGISQVLDMVTKMV